MESFWQGVDTRINAVTRQYVKPYTLKVVDVDAVNNRVKVRLPGENEPDADGVGFATGIHFDHIIPYSKGGLSTDPANIQLLCSRCNLRKGNRF